MVQLTKKMMSKGKKETEPNTRGDNKREEGEEVVRQ